MINFIMFSGIFATIIILHELLHMYVLDVHSIKYNVSILKKYHIPLGIAITSPVFDNVFTKMDRKQKIVYFKVAIAPYIYIIPLCYIFISANSFFFTFTGYVILLGQLLNLPLEFVFTKD